MTNSTRTYAERALVILTEKTEQQPRPTVQELEEILAKPSEDQVEVKPDGSVWVPDNAARLAKLQTLLTEFAAEVREDAARLCEDHAEFAGNDAYKIASAIRNAAPTTLE